MVGKEGRDQNGVAESEGLGIRIDSREKFSSETIIDVGGEPPIFPLI